MKREQEEYSHAVPSDKFNKLNQVASIGAKKPEVQTRPHSSFVTSWSGFVRKRSTILDPANEEPLKKSKIDGSLAPLRFQALNPSGSVDFVIPSLGLNQYVDMVTAHAAYWTDIRFARLILVGLFGDDHDLHVVGEKELGPDSD